MPSKLSIEDDPSNGWEAVAARLMAEREQSSIGVATVRAWGRSLAAGASILDLGCGSGVPVSQALMNDGFIVYGVDASPSPIAAYRRRFPHAHAACEAVENSRLFGRTFDGIVAVGLMFLLSADAQRDLIRRVGLALDQGGRFLFTSPAQSCMWADLTTARQSLSLRADAYKTVLSNAGLTLAAKMWTKGRTTIMTLPNYDAAKL